MPACHIKRMELEAPDSSLPMLREARRRVREDRCHLETPSERVFRNQLSIERASGELDMEGGQAATRLVLPRLGNRLSSDTD